MKQEGKKSSGWKTALWIILPLAAALFAIWLINRPKRKGAVQATDSKKGSDNSKPIQADPSAFPLKQGSRNALVKQLQNALIATYGSSVLPKYGADGDWGTETNTAVKGKLGITSIGSQDDFNKVITQLQTMTKQANNSSRADQLLSQWQANTNLQLTGGPKGALIYQYLEDAFGALNLTGQQLFIGRNERKSRDKFAITSVSDNGYLLIDKLTADGGPIGSYKVDPSDVTVS